MAVRMTVGIGTAVNDINSGIGNIVTLTPNHASLLITQIWLYNNRKSKVHLYVGTWAKGVIPTQGNSGCRFVFIDICKIGPDQDLCGFRMW